MKILIICGEVLVIVFVVVLEPTVLLIVVVLLVTLLLLLFSLIAFNFNENKKKFCYFLTTIINI